ncbi:MAG: hypothetical protein AAGF12_04675 [Myxococcota bacterium]
MNDNDRKLVVQIVGQVLIGDGILADNEREFLDELVMRLGMSGDAKKEALKGISVDSPVEDRVRQLSAPARAQLMVEVEKAAAIDGDGSEQTIVNRIRGALA